VQLVHSLTPYCLCTIITVVTEPLVSSSHAADATQLNRQQQQQQQQRQQRQLTITAELRTAAAAQGATAWQQYSLGLALEQQRAWGAACAAYTAARRHTTQQLPLPALSAALLRESLCRRECRRAENNVSTVLYTVQYTVLFSNTA
jgi:hypothetical protein